MQWLRFLKITACIPRGWVGPFLVFQPKKFDLSLEYYKEYSRDPGHCREATRMGLTFVLTSRMTVEVVRTSLYGLRKTVEKCTCPTKSEPVPVTSRNVPLPQTPQDRPGGFQEKRFCAVFLRSGCCLRSSKGRTSDRRA
jgi:hypothetical protein